MGPKIDFEKDNVERENESTANVIYDVHDNKQLFQKKNCAKGVEKHCVTKYKTGTRGRSVSRSSAGRTISHRSNSLSRSAKSPSSQSRSAGKSHTSGPCKAKSSHSSHQSSRSKPKSQVEVSAKCYDVRRGKRREMCGKGVKWQNGKYVRDECGSGIVSKRFDFIPSRKMWCKTPLSMYQATIGELARKILCREKVVPRDVRPGPPSNIEEYILPPCRGYYRKYDCLRPCEEEYVSAKGGKKHYRDRVERYWEPCLTKDQKYKLDITEYAPQNAFLAKKLRRYTMQAGDMHPPCW
ncbi:hypothetical protein V9T40_006598 [Parthenolecanium corni]|uniref:Uncharacterized protein n=1 Tax=Parthenolecanium corni TaxID=536013 RepID=A0AAN9TN02_9HEMI